MQPRTRRLIQWFLAAALILAAGRAAWIFYQRRQPLSTGKEAPPATRAVNLDYYVYPPRSYLTDFASAQKLTGTAMWVRDGYRYAHFPYDAAAHRVREVKDPPLLGPVQKITVHAVVKEPGRQPGKAQVYLAFEDAAASPPLRAVPIGVCDRKGESCRFFVDDMFFLKDPRELYSHWSAGTWKAIERGEVKEGMTETQISFGLGYPRLLPQKTTAVGEGQRVVEFQPPGRPAVVVTFGPDGYARRVETEKAPK